MDSRVTSKLVSAGEQVCLRAIVSGVVQGVNFRYYTRQIAQRLGLKGYVRNLHDGTVEVVAEGPRPAVEELFAWLQHGPSLARVRDVEATWGMPTGRWIGFEVRY
jgi:acylphosphatase